MPKKKVERKTKTKTKGSTHKKKHQTGWLYLGDTTRQTSPALLIPTVNIYLHADCTCISPSDWPPPPAPA
jgi:hypothetical protein